MADVRPSLPWISVNDALPKDGEFVLVYGKDNDEIDFGLRCKGYWEYASNDFYGNQIKHVTHWMPLLKPGE